MSYTVKKNSALSPLSPLMQCLMQGCSDACIAWFGTIERRIWDCVRCNLPAEWIGICIARSMGDEPPDEMLHSMDEEEHLRNLHLAICSARSNLGDIDDQVVLAFCDDVMRFAATVWQSWQDGYDAGWDDGVRSCHSPATFVHERPVLDS